MFKSLQEFLSAPKAPARKMFHVEHFFEPRVFIAGGAGYFVWRGVIAGVFDGLAVFEANAALTNEKSLNRLNRELRDVQS